MVDGRGSGAPGPLLGGRFEIRDRLSLGGSTEVFGALDHASGDRVVVKTLLPDVPRRSLPDLRFEHEATLLETIDHPNVVRLVHPLSQSGCVRYFVMERVKRGSLRDVLAAEPVQPLGLFLTVAVDALAALEHLHAQDIVHRDLKPDNLLLTEDTVTKLADFGIAHDQLNPLTELGDVLGTPTFMAPEQAVDPSNVRGASDLFALGAVVFHVVTGRPPVELVVAPYRVVALAAVPVPLQAWVDRATSVRPEDRFADARAMRIDAEAALAGLQGRVEGRPVRSRLPPT